MTSQNPFRIGDHVRGTAYVPPGLRDAEPPEPFEGFVVQVGTGFPKIDEEYDFVWTRLADCTERESLATDTELLCRKP